MTAVSAFVLDPEDGEAAIGVTKTGAVLAKFPSLRIAAQTLRYHRQYYEEWAERRAGAEGRDE